MKKEIKFRGKRKDTGYRLVSANLKTGEVRELQIQPGAPEHITVEVGFRKKIKIPKVDPDEMHELQINTSKSFEGRNGFRANIKKQTIAGFTFPAGYEFWVHHSNKNFLSLYDWDADIRRFKIRGERLNEILRTLYLETLRNKL